MGEGDQIKPKHGAVSYYNGDHHARAAARETVMLPLAPPCSQWNIHAR